MHFHKEFWKIKKIIATGECFTEFLQRKLLLSKLFRVKLNENTS